MKTQENIHVLLLKGGYGPEREVSLESAKACSKAIKENGFKLTEYFIKKNLLPVKRFQVGPFFSLRNRLLSLNSL